ncbi:helix-turn-helix transcriptional regulator [Vibrio sp. 404]|uniref:Helix-turn-helix transcriptional regulator n=1 Tax=Vibrio marinisediminis TaxID=2758441 RepID=A0A7W2FTE8_9VIBR|nr:helix-turn-helix transcriptional regulator [Vibrio marinisediminis]MBA5763834.1 helix-turn-helix transcriptional regulator [Vibrio marinisediminis]
MEIQLLNEITRLLKVELKKHNMAYRDIALVLNISEVSVKRLLNGQQAISLQRILAVTAHLDLSLSKLISQAEQNVNQLSFFTEQQDDAFFEFPPLFTLWSELAEQRTVEQITDRHGLDPASLYIYLRKLEHLELIELDSGNRCKLIKPSHTAFERGAKYPVFFVEDVLSRLKDRVLNIEANDRSAFLLSMKAELTAEEFQEINDQLDEWMFNKLKESQAVSSRQGLNTQPYTFGFMAAKGAFHEQLAAIPRVDDSLRSRLV